MTAIQRIVCPIDFSDCSRRGLEQAVTLARAWRAHLTVLHVSSVLAVEDLVPLANDVATRAVDPDVLRAELAAFVQPLAGDIAVELTVIRADDAAGAIAAAVDTFAADLLVIGASGHGRVERLLLGSTTARLLRTVTCPVLVVPPHAAAAHAGGFERVICGVDFSPASVAAARYAVRVMASAAELTLVHAIEVPPEVHESQRVAAFDVDAVRATAEAACLERLQSLELGEAAAGHRIDCRVVEGPACRHLLRLADEQHTDLIVLGSQAHGALDRLVFGSHASAVLRNAPCPVLMVHA